MTPGWVRVKMGLGLTGKLGRALVVHGVGAWVHGWIGEVGLVGWEQLVNLLLTLIITNCSQPTSPTQPHQSTHAPTPCTIHARPSLPVNPSLILTRNFDL